ncbi:mitochondrial import receptor subunit TOM22 homolog isoform X1 [Halyomorpha halys]|uniref:mitochondrial import receptor subunit TOM22 homolog isoform X1 n=2 Tax=Halyomorpha halys TaxID=286706 RepID=UPI0006D508DC|nr:mitochondrial import receptor subunit TOM22 homolog isoform X1 [Halyomorpha halys]
MAEETDSGVGSMPDSSKDCTPEKKRRLSSSFEEDDEDDETLAERLWGLTEMFPEKVRDASFSTFCGAKHGLKSLYSFARTSMWIIFSSSAILLAPVMFEVERAQVEEAQRSEQRQALLGPHTAIAGGSPPIR